MLRSRFSKNHMQVMFIHSNSFCAFSKLELVYAAHFKNFHQILARIVITKSWKLFQRCISAERDLYSAPQLTRKESSSL
eukprot:UN09695